MVRRIHRTSPLPLPALVRRPVGVVVGGRLSYADGMANPVRVMLEQGEKKRVVACAFNWPGWDQSARIGDDVLAVLAAYRPHYGKVAELAGFGAELHQHYAGGACSATHSTSWFDTAQTFSVLRRWWTLRPRIRGNDGPAPPAATRSRLSPKS